MSFASLGVCLLRLKTNLAFLVFCLWYSEDTYCWWTKSCTTKDDDHPIIYRVFTIPGGAGFCPSTVSYESVLVVRQDSTSFFKMTWIDTPNGGGKTALKRSLMGPSKVTLKKLVHTDNGVNSAVITLLTLLRKSQNRHVIFFGAWKNHPRKLVGGKTTTTNQPYRFEGVGRTLSRMTMCIAWPSKAPLTIARISWRSPVESGRMWVKAPAGYFFFKHQFGGWFLGGETKFVLSINEGKSQEILYAEVISPVEGKEVREQSLSCWSANMGRFLQTPIQIYSIKQRRAAPFLVWLRYEEHFDIEHLNAAWFVCFLSLNWISGFNVSTSKNLFYRHFRYTYLWLITTVSSLFTISYHYHRKFEFFNLLLTMHVCIAGAAMKTPGHFSTDTQHPQNRTWNTSPEN